MWVYLRAVGGEAADFSGYPSSQLELLECGRAQVLEQCACCIQGSWRRHQHRKQERQRQAATLIQAGRRGGALGHTATVPGQQTDLDAVPVSCCRPYTLQVSFEMLLLEPPYTKAVSQRQDLDSTSLWYPGT